MDSSNKKLVEMFYIRNNNKNEIKSVVVTEKQAYDIKIILNHIQVLKINPAPRNKTRDYVLA